MADEYLYDPSIDVDYFQGDEIGISVGTPSISPSIEVHGGFSNTTTDEITVINIFYEFSEWYNGDFVQWLNN